MTIENILKYSFSLEEVKSHFKNFTTEQLDQYNWHLHGRTITSTVERNYLSILQTVTSTRKYHLSGEIIIQHDKLYQKEDIKKYEQWIPRSLRETKLVEINCSPIPPTKIISNLEEELEQVINVLHAFKKLNWALKKKFKTPEEESDIPDLGQNIYYCIQKLHQTATEISNYHQSEKVTAFIIDEDGLSMSESNYRRNNLYHFIDVIFKK